MSVGPLGALAGSVAGTQLAQAKGSDVDRTHNEVGEHRRQVEALQQAANAAGIGVTDGEDHETADRDADGRRIWEDSRQKEQPDPAEADSAQAGSADADQPRSKDVTGQSGTLLDLSG